MVILRSKVTGVNSFVNFHLRFPKYSKCLKCSFSNDCCTSSAMCTVPCDQCRSDDGGWYNLLPFDRCTLLFSICPCFAAVFACLQCCGSPYPLPDIMGICLVSVRTCTEKFICLCVLHLLSTPVHDCLKLLCVFMSSRCFTFMTTLVTYTLASCCCRLIDFFARCNPNGVRCISQSVLMPLFILLARHLILMRVVLRHSGIKHHALCDS